MSLPEPNFIDRDISTITADIVSQYELISGKTLYPAQSERLLLDVIAYRESLLRIGIQEAAKQNLVAYAKSPMLEYLGELVGCTRLPAIAAKTTLRFTLPVPLDRDISIQPGFRVEVGDGSVTFTTDTAVTLTAGSSSVDARSTCTESGVIGNGWQPGQISNAVDTLEIDFSVANITTAANGAEIEDIERFRERIKLAPEAFSTAGSRLAYRYHAMSAHQDIVDVAVLPPTPGVVNLYPLMVGGLPDESMLSLVAATCSGEKVRPLTDNVAALAPTAVEYGVAAQLVLYASADVSSTLTMARANVASYVSACAAGLGIDVVPSQLIAALQVAGVYQVVLSSPAALIQVADDQWASCTGITLSHAVVGYV